MGKLKRMLPILGIIGLCFYLLPVFIKDTGSAMAVLLVALPLVCFLSSILFGILNPFSFIFPLLVAVLFLPSIFIFYNSSAWVYSFAFGVIALVGTIIGRLLVKQRKTSQQ